MSDDALRTLANLAPYVFLTGANPYYEDYYDLLEMGYCEFP